MIGNSSELVQHNAAKLECPERGVQALNVWAVTILQAWLLCTCLLSYINTFTIWFLSKWLWGKKLKYWDTWQESGQVCCSDHISCLAFWKLVKADTNSSTWEITCLLCFLWWRKLVFHPRHAFGPSSSQKPLCFHQMLKEEAHGSCINTIQ